MSNELNRKEASNKLIVGLHAMALASDGGYQKYEATIEALLPLIYTLAHSGLGVEDMLKKCDKWFAEDFGS